MLHPRLTGLGLKLVPAPLTYRTQAPSLTAHKFHHVPVRELVLFPHALLCLDVDAADELIAEVAVKGESEIERGRIRAPAKTVFLYLHAHINT
jgi:hypothetical protein